MTSLLAAVAVLFLQFIFLHDFAFDCSCRLVSPSLFPLITSLLVATAVLFPKLYSFMISLLAAAASLSPKLVSLPDFALGCRRRLVSQACLPA